MRHLRITLGIATAVCALALTAAPALAHEFISSGGKSTGKGQEQVFHFGIFKITCMKATTKGGEATPLASQTFFTSARFQKCSTRILFSSGSKEEGHLLTTFKTPLDIEYHANGFVEIGSEGEEIEGDATLKGGEVEIKIHAVKCIIRLPEQTIPHRAETKPEGKYNAAEYENVEEGGRHKLLITNEFKLIHYEYGEGQCEGFETSEEERSQGKYTGELLEEIKAPKGKGSLEFQ